MADTDIDAPNDIEERVLCAIEKLPDTKASLSSEDLSKTLNLTHINLVDNGLKTLVQREAARTETITNNFWRLREEGEEYVRDGTPEYRLFMFLKVRGGAAKDELEKEFGGVLVKRGLGILMKRKVIGINGESRKYECKCKVEGFFDEVAEDLRRVKDGEKLDGKVLKDLKKRQLVEMKTYKTFRIFKGGKIGDARKVQATELTKEMLESGDWKNKAFKKYNMTAEGKIGLIGHLHTLLKVREQYRLIFLEMGFDEMPTNNFVESSFWNFDALFQPQQHPARDEHDTFFISDPAQATIPDEQYMKRVKEVHEKGGYGSRGYRYDWSLDEAKKNILRTHTTAVSSRMLYELAKETAKRGEFRPKRYFSIDRVFRNETLDATHLAEFHQVEGLVADTNLSLGHLKGVIHEFFKKVGVDKMRFKPTHNPYTNPSLEIHAYHEKLAKWVEVGNSGVFRPEMIRPMGIPEDVNVIAWGLSLERPTMIKYGINNIRDLFGYKMDIQTIQSNPMCRLTF
eukprot:Plantae.Rhodophyta-Hildenbrandia_rubra.ctg20784.p1 GENE.Plantae.Rhodophyta-Hildenbrandia_rubra.ctg20784~~Plantae.Rhodophyta-Hildenbrandia_rubra.ctg20784.p1  ORF type:complete len:526 (-),score=101.05 Plantae.Rhodophyta-Hildenbrandia_rubra.ctg20784:73-1608(-)